MKSRGKLILFADADGASKFSDYEKLENTILKNTSSLDVYKTYHISLIILLSFNKICTVI